MRLTSSLLFALCCIAAAGCQSHKPEEPMQAEMPAEPQERAVWRALDAQIAAGARSDATLSARHFDDSGKLNSLGRDKLAMMLTDADARPAAVYMNWRSDDKLASARRASIETWLKDAGMEPDAVALKEGPNLNASSPAAPNLARLWKTESPGLQTMGSQGAGSAEEGMAPQGFEAGNGSR